MDGRGKDSYRLKNSGSVIGGLFTDECISIFRDFNERKDLEKFIEDIFNDMDLVLIEGYKVGKYPKIVIMKSRDQEELREYDRDEIMAVAGEAEIETELNYFGKYEIKKVADLLEIEFIKPYSEQDIKIYINSRPILLNDFVQKIVKNIINAIVASLKDIEKEIKEIDLRYRKRS
jgi:molybdopterin-guanine dinucleotide biosynthesis protein MobB